MESKRFDELVRGTFSGATRRGMMRVGASAVAATALAILGRDASDVDAKKKRKRKRSAARATVP